MTKRILFADNDSSSLAARKEFLEQEGYEVLPAATVDEARRVLEHHLVDLAVIDVRLSTDTDERDWSGLALANETDKAIPKIILTRYPTYDLVREALGPHLDGLPAAVDFVAKQEG